MRMAEDGLLSLPPPRRKPPPQPTIIRPVHELASVQLCPVITRDQSRLWNEYIYRYHYHYLGHKPLPGAQLRYFVTIDLQIIAPLAWCSRLANSTS